MFTRYSVRRTRELRFIIDSIELCGGKVLNDPSPLSAPFELEILMPDGEVLDVICYAFYANKYRQGGRPTDEHRLQIKYGNDFKSYHEIYVDPTRKVLTLMFGVHLDEEIFVAADPVMHNPTWFSKSIEFKNYHVQKVQETGWFSWERERSKGRRKVAWPLESCQTEALLAFTPDNFLRYIRFEKLASGLETGLRIYLADGFGADQGLAGGSKHSLEGEFQLPAWRILDLIAETRRLKVAVRGSVAEDHLRRYLEEVPDMDRVTILDEDGRPDFEVQYKGSGPFLIECKNVLRRSAPRVKVDFQKTRSSIKDPCTRYYRSSDFHVLAACLFPVTEAWRFRFCATRFLPPHKKCEGRLSQHVYVEGNLWDSSIANVIDQVS